MRVLITGICGFVGSSLARQMLQDIVGLELLGIDNLSRPGSELNRAWLLAAGVQVIHGDLRTIEDVDSLPAVDWVIDAAAKPSVLGGIGDAESSRQVVENNLCATIHLLEYCKRHGAGFILLSTSRVYSINGLVSLRLETHGSAYRPLETQNFKPAVSPAGLTEAYSTCAPVSLYGATGIGDPCA